MDLLWLRRMRGYRDRGSSRRAPRSSVYLLEQHTCGYRLYLAANADVAAAHINPLTISRTPDSRKGARHSRTACGDSREVCAGCCPTADMARWSKSRAPGF